MASMTTFVTANMASGSSATTTRTLRLATTIRGDASQTILKMGSVSRSAARRSLQRGTGLCPSVGKSLIPLRLAAARLHHQLGTELPSSLSRSAALPCLGAKDPDGNLVL